MDFHAKTASGPDGPVVDFPVTESTALLNGHRELRIRHGSDTYRLRLTPSGKLILTK
ncbi:Hemin uptake protein HemP [Rhodospirillales bacterium URHD0017]|nr:Hemin uptake protein HemP [Rhodospirillales bacterium URHD0017]